MLRHLSPRAVFIAILLLSCCATRLASQGPAGRIAGRVLDAATGRPIVDARITQLPDGARAVSDLDGRFRLLGLGPGRVTLRIAAIGYTAMVRGVDVSAGQAAVIEVALSGAVVEVQELVVQAEGPVSQRSDAGMLAVQQAAPVASDGVSAQAMARSPDADAGEAVRRVTGVAVVDDKFVVVRGLNERYSGTLLNGAELASPEPLKKVAPLDMFPAGLLEAIVTTKAATPDKPGDFAGGLVEIRTKDFPENPVAQLSVSQTYNSQTTGRAVPMIEHAGLDYLGFDRGRRAPGPGPFVGVERIDERTAESFRNVWTPRAQAAPFGGGLGLTLGGSTESGGLGYIFSFTYGSRVQYVPERLFQYYNGAPVLGFRSRESSSTVDWGMVANVAAHLGAGTKLSWRNLYTRNAEETAISGDAFNVDADLQTRQYNIRYVERGFLQTQLVGEHAMRFLLDSRLEWRGTLVEATRGEPDNRTIAYVRDPSSGELTLSAARRGYVFMRDLDDRILSGQVDWSVPFGLRAPGDALFKVGGLYRFKRRDYVARTLSINLDPADPLADVVAHLPPEEAFAPENVGSAIIFSPSGEAQSYYADDALGAAYGMLDLAPFPWLRAVGGMRVEDWQLDLFDGAERGTPAGTPNERRDRDYLASGALTFRLSSRANFRLAAFQSVSRPDPREISLDEYIPVGGECAILGSPELRRASIRNADARFELFDEGGELTALSAFYKEFTDPIIETVEANGFSSCRIRPRNALSATNYGWEFEVRRRLSALPGPFTHLFLGVNLTQVESRVALDPALGQFDPELDLQGQSPFLTNVSLAWEPPEGKVSVSVLFNSFSDRLHRYGASSGGAQPPNILERGRTTVDAKLRWVPRPGLSVSLSGKNLGDAESVTYVEGRPDIHTGFSQPGRSLGLGLSYDY